MTESRAFNYSKLFAADAPISTRSENLHAKYDFAVAYPDPDTLPLNELIDSLKTAIDREGRDLAYYPSPLGLPALRQLVSEKLSRDRDIHVSAEEIVLTSGSGEAILMLIQALTNPGDVVLTEEYVYSGTLRQMKLFGSDVRSVTCDDDGLIPQALEDVIRKAESENKPIKYLYTIPCFQNPLGWTMSLDRRKKILEITRSHGIPILEDDCYVDLRFEGEDITSIHSLDDTGQVMYVGSFSKIVAPGMRLGYLVAPQEVRERALSFKAGAANQFAALAVQEYLSSNLYSHIDEHNQALRVKRDAMVSALGENFGNSAEWTVPSGGLYIWMRMPEGTDLAAFQQQAFDEGVGYQNGTMFSPEGTGANCARLCFGHPDTKTITDGIAELANIMGRHGIIK